MTYRCTGCGSTWSDEKLAEEKRNNPKLISCCPERKMQPETWGVSVSVFGENILTIESAHLSGVSNIDSYTETIRNCAHHLLSFIGDSHGERRDTEKQP